MQKKLQEIKEIIPIMKSLMDEDLAISIWDREGTVVYFQKPETFNLDLEVGFRLEDKNDKLFKAMNTGKVIHNSLPKEAFGVPIEGNLVPVFDEGKVIGCVVCAYYSPKAAELENKTNKMKNVLEGSKDSICDILKAAINSANYLKEINEYLNNLEQSIDGVHRIVDAIKGNTARTKMLALNASIEAARAGESGRGFTIVANEMGKLSQMSTESVADINKTLNDIEKSINYVTESIKKIDEVSFKNSELVETILSDLNKISD
ncbi:histidine kinase N-terminal domain-containing protein [uncultured Clostridium sp.]|uniref:histidine kinase N-terminal domain-containing protein n=1 Tax=uncultured Clostridium sp. TaxID=59620 RepID=UPI0025FF8A5E|nr:histidine kinase N-terminal domain-containing protein [uncultured Clostridium sp.]